jgi:DNA-damage-inducible protein D
LTTWRRFYPQEKEENVVFANKFGYNLPSMKTLDELKNVSQTGIEYWWARDIMPNLGYSTWENFSAAINRAKQACENAQQKIHDHFRDVTKEIAAGKGARGFRADVAITRFGCYLVAMNGDPSKAEIAFAMTYFAVQTLKQEDLEQLTEIERRQLQRDRVKKSVKELGDAAKKAGVRNYGRFTNEGYQGLYGMSLQQLRTVKRLPEGEDFLDCIGRAELAANEFKNTQTELRIRKEGIVGEDEACATHRDVGSKVRKIMISEGGTEPENLPAEKSLKAIQREARKSIDKGS